MASPRGTYVFETRDTGGRWHRPRQPRFLSAAFAIKRGGELLNSVYTLATAYRIVNTETNFVEYESTRVADLWRAS